MTDPVPFGMYDFDNDPGWQEYVRRAEIPIHSLAQAKARWYQREVNPNFVTSGAPGSLGSGVPVHLSTAGVKQEAPVSGQSAAFNLADAGSPGFAHAQGAASANNSVPRGAPAAGQGANATTMAGKLQPYLQTLNTYVVTPAVALSHGMLVLLFVTYLATMFFHPRLSIFAYRNFLLLAAFNHLGKVFQRFGPPPVMPYRGFEPTLDALKSWMVPVAATTDLQYAIICVSLLGTRPLLPAIIPMAVLAVFHSSYQLNTHFGANSLWRQYGRPLHTQLFANLEFAQQANAGAEIVSGFLMIALLLTPSRNILQTFLYWQILRVRYWSPDCSACHRQAWNAIGQKAQPALDCAPFLKTPIGFVRQWFLNAGQQMQAVGR